ncbi:agmatine/peptidylarginine deiminase [Amycolatopsis sp. NPDC049868]|uniref:agmatine/peptidylarginine deiminase n=1 Tax=Amycolatopsis sp. NPDC049868 TaxID=3363934 RepID=UPI003797A759
MPAEGQPHARTWMAFGAGDVIWTAALLPQARNDLAGVATTISRFEPVSMLVRPDEVNVARELLGPANVELISSSIDDLWIRDTGPAFVKGEPGLAGVNFNFNGWGGKQVHDRDAKVSGFVTGQAGAPSVCTDLVLEGGALEVDGEGTVVITESCVLNANRNPGKSKGDVEAELDRLLGVRKIIWLPWITGRDITDGHTDGYARFTRPGTVVAGLDTDPQSLDHEVTVRHLEILRSATAAQNRPLGGGGARRAGHGAGQGSW